MQGNLIGTDSTGTKPIPNGWQASPSGGWGIYDASGGGGGSGDLIGGTTQGTANIIAYSNGPGVVAGGALIEGNSIYGNTGLGIDSNGQSFPILTAASSSSVTITGTFNSTANHTYRLELFSNSSPGQPNPSDSNDPNLYGQGQTYLGFATITTMPTETQSPPRRLGYRKSGRQLHHHVSHIITGGPDLSHCHGYRCYCRHPRLRGHIRVFSQP